MKFAVGSRNSVKIKAVENAVKRFWEDAEVIGLEVEHGTNSQPRSDEEAISGATKRARLVIEKSKADFGFGLEGSVSDTDHGMFVVSWVVAVDKDGTLGIGCGGSLLLPEKIAKEIRKGKELGKVMDDFIGKENTKHNEGTVGILTKNAITRTEKFEHGVIYALARFVNPEYYK